MQQQNNTTHFREACQGQVGNTQGVPVRLEASSSARTAANNRTNTAARVAESRGVSCHDEVPAQSTPIVGGWMAEFRTESWMDNENRV